MKLKLATNELTALFVIKFRALVTNLVSAIGVALVASTCLISVVANAASPGRQPAPGSNINPAYAQALIDRAYELTQSRHVKGSVQAFSQGDRWVNSCTEECSCIAQQFRAALSAHGFSTKLISLSPAQKSIGLKIRGARPSYGILTEASYSYHVALAVRVRGGWRVVDPLVLQSTQLEPFAQWRARIEPPYDLKLN